MPHSKTDLDIKRISGSLGAEIHDVDVRSLDDATTTNIRQALLDHKVIFFRDQTLTPAEFLAFSRLLGEPVEYPFVKGLPDHPEIIEVLKRPEETQNFGGVWHSDTLYLDKPPKATLLLAQELPPHGGDTLFANQAAAYASLSPALQSTLAPLRAINTSTKADASATREDRVKDSSAPPPAPLISSHPVVRTHPETGAKTLYVNAAHTERFDGWTAQESAGLLAHLHDVQVRPEFTCRFAWAPGSLAVWDNRAVLHNPVNDYQGYGRRMLRVTLGGDVPE